MNEDGGSERRTLRVLVVEDSATVREFLVRVLESDPGIHVVGTAASGEHALDALRRLRPDVITMDIHMPGIGGLQATRRIMETEPVPVVIVSGSTDPNDVSTAFSALEAGAVAVLPRPAGIGGSAHETSVRELLDTVKAMAEVKLVRRWPAGQGRRAPTAGRALAAGTPRIVAIGASTGGPPALQRLLGALPRDFPLPIVLVQHMAPGFIDGFAEWLGKSCRLGVRVAVDGDVLAPGRAFVAPDGRHMTLAPGGRVVLRSGVQGELLCPSVARLFRSVATIYGKDAVAGVLSGMGRDGAEELLQLRRIGAVTFAQDEASSVVHGMPGEAIRLGAVSQVLSPQNIAALLVDLLRARY